MFGCFSCGSAGYSGCWVSLLLCLVAWWLVSSALVYFTWNHVVSKVTSAKVMAYSQALLLAFTLGALSAPHWMANKSGCVGKRCPSCSVKTLSKQPINFQIRPAR